MDHASPLKMGSNVIGQAVIGALENAVKRLPVVSLLYTSLKDLLGAFVGDKKSFDYFLEHGWDSGVQSDATIKSGKKGGSVVDVAAAANYEKIKVYNLTASGIALQATLQGYKYWQDGELNIRKPAPVSSAR